MSGVALALFVGGPVAQRVATELFPAAETVVLTPPDLRPSPPFRGRLFSVLAAQPRGGCVGLVIPVRLSRGASPAAEDEKALAAAPGALLPIADHVNLELRGPLTGRWPAGVPREFPSLTGKYQPAVVRAAAGPRVYSSGVVAAGVADARWLAGFELRAVREAGTPVVSDSLVPIAIVAAYYGLRLAACGVLRALDRDRERGST